MLSRVCFSGFIKLSITHCFMVVLLTKCVLCYYNYLGHKIYCMEHKEMKSLFKKSAISLIILGMAGTSYAAMSAANNNSWSSPHMKGWFIGVDGLWLQPRNDDLDFVTVFPNTSTGAVSTKAISPDYDWGFRLFGGIKFGDNNDVTAGWTRFHTDDSSSISDPAGSIPSILGFSQPRWFPSDQWKNIHADVNFDLDDVWLVMGHTINFNNPWSVRFAGGLEYAKLDSDLDVQASTTGSSSTTTTLPNRTYEYDNTLALKGIGPRVEGNATYHLPNNFALFMDANAALLISKRDIALNAFNPAGVTTFESITYSDRHIVVPHLGMRIGLNWSYYFGQAGGEGTCNVVTVEAGWQADTYIDAIERNNGSSSSLSVQREISTIPVTPGTTTKDTNYSNQGLFLGVNFSSNWF